MKYSLYLFKLILLFSFLVAFTSISYLNAQFVAPTSPSSELNEDNAIPSSSNDTGTVEGIEETINLKRIFSEPPYYPRKALRLGYEGYVNIQFDIAKDGTVLDPYVVESSPPGVFERAAIKAVRKWVYEAPVFNGQNVNVNNVTVKLGFNLE